MERQARLFTLDAMRGIAALAVLLFHMQRTLVFSGYLAVDFFFLLSGFVIARTYEARLDHELTFAEFVEVRFIRLYPLFAVGLVVGLVHRAGQCVLSQPDSLTTTQLIVSTVMGVFMLPSPATARIFPLNDPGWSLFFELAINLVYGWALFRARSNILSLVAIGCGVLLVATALWNGSLDVGTAWRNIYGGIPRVGFSFTLGILIARLRRNRSHESWLAAAPMAGLVGLLTVHPPENLRVAYDLLVAGVAGPWLVWMGATYNPPRSFRRVSELLGEVSYALYIVHYPLLAMARSAAISTGLTIEVWAPVFAVSIGLTAWVLNEYWDKPIRARLSSAVHRGSRFSPGPRA